MARGIGFVCSDMCTLLSEYHQGVCTNALNLLDRFHVMVHNYKTIHELRACEARSLAKSGKGQVLKHSRWALLKEQFQQLWTYSSAGWPSRFLRGWTFLAMDSARSEPLRWVSIMTLVGYPNLSSPTDSGEGSKVFGSLSSDTSVSDF